MSRHPLVEVAFSALYDEDVSLYSFSLSYSAKFSAYNANVRYRGRKIDFHLSHLWRDVSSEITVGILQHLMLKVFKGKLVPRTLKTLNIDLYNHFLKEVHKYTAKKEQDPYLLSLFEEVNAGFFNGLMEAPNLVWGTYSTRTLGHYAYGSDRITMSRIFEGIDDDKKHLVKFVMYHEMLHKKHKFNDSATGRNMHHTTAFRNEEALFPNFKQVDKELSQFASQFKRRKAMLNYHEMRREAKAAKIVKKGAKGRKSGLFDFLKGF